MKCFVVHWLLATIWLLLSDEPTLGRFVIGWILGYVLLIPFQGLLSGQSYVRRVWAFGRFVLVFATEFIAANASVVGTVLFRSRDSLYPAFVQYDVSGLRPVEILLLSYCISLTPGSTTVRVDDDFRHLILHGLDVRDADRFRERIDRVLRRGILEFTR